MKFPAYLKFIGMRPYVFATEHKINSFSVWQASKGKPVGGKIALKIREATQGACTLDELLNP